MAFNAWHYGGHEPAGQAHLDDGDDCAVLYEGTPGSAQVMALGHGALLWLAPPAMMHCPRRVPIASDPSGSVRVSAGATTRTGCAADRPGLGSAGRCGRSPGR